MVSWLLLEPKLFIELALRIRSLLTEESSLTCCIFMQIIENALVERLEFLTTIPSIF